MTTKNSNEQELRYQLALARAPGFGPRTYQRLLQYTENSATLFNDPQLQAQLKLSPATKHYLRQPAWQEVEHDLRWLEQPQHHFITFTQPHYPALLQHIHAPPPWLFVCGDLQVLQQPQLAMVGSRNPSHAGYETAMELAQALAMAGLIITSGLALGIDGASHRAALQAHAPTIAVLGNGLRSIYPRRHQTLAAAIATQGALVSEFALDQPPLAAHFPQRNRIISGLSLGTLVVEAALNSGSLITAQCALEQGREVFAIPSSIHNPRARGCHGLIQQGAKLVTTAADVLAELPTWAAQPLAEPSPAPMATTSQPTSPIEPSLDRAHYKLLECIDFTLTSVEQMVRRSGLPAAQVLSLLLIIELHGYIRPADGGYVRVK